MTRTARLFVTLVIAAGISLVGHDAAHAATCSARTPATLTLVGRRNFDGERLRAVHGKERRTEGIIEYRVTGCELAASEVPVRVHGLPDSTVVTARLVPKSPHDMSLLIHVDTNRLAPGDYDLSAGTGSAALPLVVGLGIDVKDGDTLPPALTWLGACLLGIVVLGLRAAAASDVGFKSFWKFFTGMGWLLPAGAGVAAAWAAFRSQFLVSDTWFGSTEELVTLGVAALGAMVAAGTGATAVTKAAART